MYAMQHIIPIHSMYSLQHSIPIQQVPDTANLVEDTHIAQDWSYTPTQQVLIAAYHSNTPLLHRTGQVSKHSLCSELGRYQNTHTQDAGDWVSVSTHHVHRTGQGTRIHTVHKAGQVQKHTESA